MSQAGVDAYGRLPRAVAQAGPAPGRVRRAI